MTQYLIAMFLTLCLVLGWVVIQHITRWYAIKHPEFGPAREEGGGCGNHCNCQNAGHCQRQ